MPLLHVFDSSASTARPDQSRKIHPITWVAAALLIPLLIWDVRQTVRELNFHHASIQSPRSGLCTTKPNVPQPSACEGPRRNIQAL